MRVLLAEDHRDLRKLLDLTLGSQGCQVTAAADGAAALAMLDDARPDALVTDYLMPNMNGGELVRAVRARPEYRDIPVLVVTANRDLPGVREMEGMFRLRIMAKPPSFRSLAAVLRELAAIPSPPAGDVD